jgi:hypothetical protein
MSDIERICKALCNQNVKVYPHPRYRRVMAAGRIYHYNRDGIITKVEVI